MPNDTPAAERPPSVVEPEKGTRLSAVEIHDNILAGATEDAERPVSSLFWSALASGAVIGFSFLAGGYLSTLAVSEPHKKALAAAGYPLGFIFVVIGRLELFTENTLEPVLPLLHERTTKRMRDLLRLWAVLLVGNMIGALVFGALVARTAMVGPEVHEGLRSVAESATAGGFGLVFYRAIYAGWLIAGLSWLLGATTARGAQIVLIWLCTATIAALEFRHSIAGAVEAFYRVFIGAASWGEMVGGFIVPAVLGNAVGGVVLVALLNYAQVKKELPERPHTRE
jgi:formate/nitrite transporter FocA (FNT family)